MCLADFSDGLREKNAHSLSQLKSAFATRFCEEIAEDVRCLTIYSQTILFDGFLFSVQCICF